MSERPQNKHLVPFKSGDEWRGNPNGRPKGSVSITTLLREAANKKRLCTQGLPDDLTAAEALAEAMYYHAIKGNAAYAKEIIERLDGKAPDVIEAVNRVRVEVEFVDGDTDNPEDQAPQAPPGADAGGTGDGPV